MAEPDIHTETDRSTPGAPDGAARDAGSDRAPRRARRWGRRVAIGFGLLLGIPLALVVLVLLFLQTPWGADVARNVAVDYVNENVLTGATLEVGDLDGTFLTRLAVHDARLVADDGTELVRVDTLRASYRLLSLLRGTVDLREVIVRDPVLQMRQQADSTWDLMNVLPTGADTTADTTTMRIVLDQLRLQDGAARLQFYAPERDSVLQVSDLNVRLHDLLVGESIAVQLDSLWTDFSPPGLSYTASLRLGGTLTEDSTLTISGLALTSPQTEVTGHGTLRLPSVDDPAPQNVDFSLSAAPLAFRDLHAFVPGLDPAASMTLDADVRSDGQQYIARITGSTSDGGTLRLDALATPPGEDPLRYRLDAEISQLNPGLFVAQDSLLAGTVNLTATADLQGSALTDLSGPFQAHLTDTRLGPYALDETVLDGTFADGQARLNFETGLRGASLYLSGTTRPFADMLTADLEGRFTRVDIGRLLDDPTQASTLNGTFGLQGEGTSLETATLQTNLTLAPSSINDYRIDEGVLAARLADGSLAFDTRFSFPEGRILAEGSANLEGDEPQYQITTGRIDQLDVAALTGDTTQSSITGSFRLEGRGTVPETMNLQADVTLEPSVYGAYEFEAADVSARLNQGRLALNANAALSGGAFDLTATARPFAARPSYTVSRARFQNVNIGALIGVPDQQSDLNGTLSLTGSGFDPATMTLDAELALDRSQLNDQTLAASTSTVHLQDGALAFDVTIDQPEGSTRLAGTATPFAEVPSYEIQEGRFEHLNVGALAGMDAWTTDLSGTLALDGRGLDPSTATLTALLDLAPSTINDQPIQEGRLEAALADGYAELTGRFNAALMQAEVDASGRFFDEQPQYEASGFIENLDLARLTGVDTLNIGGTARFEVEGTGFEPATMHLEGALTGQNIRYQTVRVNDAEVNLQLADGMVQVDTLRIRSNIANAHGSGAFALTDSTGTRSSDFSFTADLLTLEPLQPILAVDVLALSDGRITGRVFGPPGTLRLDLQTTLNSLVYNDFRLAGFEARARGELTQDRTLEMGEVRGTLSYASVPALTIENTQFEASYADEELRFLTDMTVDQRRDARLGGRVELNPDNQRIVIEDFGLRFDEDQWELLQEATITYDDAYRVSGLLLYADDQQIALDGVLDFDGRQSLILTIEQFRIGAVADLFEFEGLDGILNGYVDLTGPAEAPNLSGSLNLDLASNNRDVGTLDLQLAYDSLRLRTDARLAHEDGSALRLNGYVPMDLRLAPGDSVTQGGVQVSTESLEGTDAVDLTLQSDSFAIGWVQPFLDPSVVNRIDGYLTAEVTIAGTFDSPNLRGSTSLSNGRLGLPDLGVEYRNINAQAEWEENRIVLREASMTSSSGRLGAATGRLTAEGAINLEELTLGRFDLSFRAREFRVINTSDYQILINADDCSLQGTTQEPTFTCGEPIVIPSANIYLSASSSDASLDPVSLTEADLRMLEQHFGIRVTEADTSTFDFYEALALDITVRLERDTWLRSTGNPEMSIQFTGDLDVQKEPNGEEQIFGTIEVIPERSQVQQFGRLFSVTSGTLTFNGSIEETRLDISAEYSVPARENTGEEPVIITLTVSGSLDDLDIELGSENPPNMETSDIISYVVFGRPASQTFLLGGSGGGNTSVSEIGTNLALGQITSMLENTLGQELGLDVIEIEQDGLRGTTITAGSYYTLLGLPNPIYTAVSQPISYGSGTDNTIGTAAQQTEITIEYELFSGLLIRLEGPEQFRINLRWRTSY